MRTLIFIPKLLLLFLSIFCIMASPAAFTPAVFLAFLLMCISGVIAVFGEINLAVLNLALNSIAIGISPVTDMEHFGHSISLSILYAIPFVVGFGGVIIGIIKLRRSART